MLAGRVIDGRDVPVADLVVVERVRAPGPELAGPVLAHHPGRRAKGRDEMRGALVPKDVVPEVVAVAEVGAGRGVPVDGDAAADLEEPAVGLAGLDAAFAFVVVDDDHSSGFTIWELVFKAFCQRRIAIFAWLLWAGWCGHGSGAEGEDDGAVLHFY